MHVRVGDVRLYFDVAGSGLVPEGRTMRQRPEVLCPQGGPGFDHSFLKHWLMPLADEVQLVFLDRRGQGRSDESAPERWNLDTWIEDVRTFCDVLGIEQPILIGQSFGGIVALGGAIRHSDLPGRLVVSSSTARLRLDRALPMFEALGGRDARAVAESFFTDASKERFEAFLPTCLPLYNPTPIDPDVLARVRLRPEVALHFFRGEAFSYDGRANWVVFDARRSSSRGVNPITTVRDHEEMAASMPTSRLEVFDGAGHGVFRDKAAEALAVIKEFIFSPP